MKFAILCSFAFFCLAALSVEALLLPPKLKAGDTIGFVSPGMFLLLNIISFSTFQELLHILGYYRLE